jgi:hypothetical protein
VYLLLPLESRRRNERGRYGLASSIDLEAGKMGGLGVINVMARVDGVFWPGALQGSVGASFGLLLHCGE